MKSQANTDIIFVAGFPRSGTTWFSNLINSHSKVIYRHELIGRNYTMFGEQLFDQIKYNNGLTDEQYAAAMKVVYAADVNTDKPPFFNKEIGASRWPKLHHGLWFAAKVLPPFRPIYNQLFKVPSDRNDFKVLIKETRSTTDMQSMLTSLRVQNKLFLIRVPQGSIASHLSGIKQGKMGKPSAESKRTWFQERKDNDYILGLNLSDEDVVAMSDAEFFAISWRLYHMEMLRIKAAIPGVVLCFYEDFVAEPVKETKSLFDKIQLEYNESVERFIQASSGNEPAKQLVKDSNNEFYSVYRGASFKADAWRDKLSSEEIAIIDQHTADIYQQMRTLA